jgi:hypothetical protein
MGGVSRLASIPASKPQRELEDHEAVDVIKEWFLSNFEDPVVQQSPREEGEYVYIWGDLTMPLK